LLPALLNPVLPNTATSRCEKRVSFSNQKL